MKHWPSSTGIPGDEVSLYNRRFRVRRLRGLIWLVLCGAFYWALRELLGKKSPKRQEPEGESEEMVRDPQCGVYIPRSNAIRKRVRGEMLYFCSKECEEKYNGKPGV